MTEQRSLLDALEPIDPYGYVDRIPGVDAPCFCHGGPYGKCAWPWCPWPDHQPTQRLQLERGVPLTIEQGLKLTEIIGDQRAVIALQGER